MRLVTLRTVFAGALLACHVANRPEGGPTLAIKPDANNFFRDATSYVSPQWKEELASVAEDTPDRADAIRSLASQPVAIWINRADLARTEVAKAVDAAGTGLVVLVIDDLPNRHCARAMAGDLGLKDESRYRAEVIDSVALSIATRSERRVVIVLEPSSLASLVTHPNADECTSSDAVYRSALAYAVSRLSAVRGVQIYLDAGNAESLGSDDNRAKIVAIFKDVLDRAGGDDKVRGFATNIGGYSPISDELRYINKLSADLVGVGILDKFFVIDTSRNGRGFGARKNATSWCNLKGAGLGERPRAVPAPGIDAYFWFKVPIESDGTSNSYRPSFDATCASEDATLHAPEQGQVFPAYFAELVRLANPPLTR